MYKRTTSLQEVEARIGRKWKVSQRASKPREMVQEYFAQEKVPMQVQNEQQASAPSDNVGRSSQEE